MINVLRSLEGWSKVTFQEIVSKNKQVKNSSNIYDVILRYCIATRQHNYFNLHIVDRGVLVSAFISRGDNGGEILGTFLSTEIFIPRANPNDNGKDYTTVYHCEKNGIIDDTTSSKIYDFICIEVDLQVKDEVAEDYYKYNHGLSLFNVYINDKKHIFYLDIEADHKYVDENISYEDIIHTIYNTEERVVYSKEGGVYYIDKYNGADRLLFAKLACGSIYGDAFFSTLYYLVDHTMTKTYISIEEAHTILDTVQLAATYKNIQLLSLSPTEEDIQKFEIDKEQRSMLEIIKSALQNTPKPAYNSAARYNYTIKLNSNADIQLSGDIDVFVNNPIARSTDFSLFISINDYWITSSKIVTAIIDNINFTEIFKMIVKESYYMRSENETYTIFNSNIILAKSDTLNQLIIKALKSSRDVLVTDITDRYVSIWVMPSLSDDYYNIIFYYEGDEITGAELSVGLEDKFSSAKKIGINSDDVNYISLSLILYIKNTFADFFKPKNN